MSIRPDPWFVDPDDPRAPPESIWAELTEEQRQTIVDSLPSEFAPSESHPPEGDLHTDAVYDARSTLRRFFGKTGRSIYVGTNLPVYYPGHSMLSPDVIAVLDVPTHPRPSWIVSREGKGLDFALEVMVLGNRNKDLTRNVDLYSRLGIREYFVFDRPKARVFGFRLRPGTLTYEPLVPQRGRLTSEVLGLDLRITGDRLQFCVGEAELPGSDALISQLEGFLGDLETRLAVAESRAEQESQRAREEAQRAREEAQRAQEASGRADLAEARLREALEEIERLKASLH